jgi:hypothetical protein
MFKNDSLEDYLPQKEVDLTLCLPHLNIAIYYFGPFIAELVPFLLAFEDFVSLFLDLIIFVLLEIFRVVLA